MGTRSKDEVFDFRSWTSRNSATKQPDISNITTTLTTIASEYIGLLLLLPPTLPLTPVYMHAVAVFGSHLESNPQFPQKDRALVGLNFQQDIPEIVG